MLSREFGERLASQESERLSSNIHEGHVPEKSNPEVINLIVDQYRETPQGPGMPLGAFSSGNPLERIVAISDK